MWEIPVSNHWDAGKERFFIIHREMEQGVVMYIEP